MRVEIQRDWVKGYKASTRRHGRKLSGGYLAERRLLLIGSCRIQHVLKPEAGCLAITSAVNERVCGSDEVVR